MSDEIGHVVGTMAHAEPDGSQMVQVAIGDRTIEVRIDPEHVAMLLNRLQSAAIAHAQTAVRNLSVPQVTATDIGLAHQGSEVGLLVSTNQMGTLVIRLTDQQADDLRSELDRMKTYRPASPQTQ